MIIRYLTRILALALAVGFVAGCGQQQTDARNSSADAGPQGEPRAGGDLVVALQADGKTLDPHRASDAASMRLCENLYSTLFRYTEVYGETTPDLVTEHSYNDDRTQLSLTIRDDVVFHSGNPLTAEDVAFSLERMRESAGRRQQFATLEEVTIDGPHQVTLHLTQPMAPLITFLAHPMSAIVEKAIVEANDGNLDRVDAGSGPFALVEWKNDQFCKLEKFAGYHVPERPYLDTLTFRPIPDNTGRQIALRNGEIDMILDVSARNQRVLDKVDDIRVESVPGTFWEYVGMNTEKPPFDQVEVRQAVAWALSRDEMNTVVKFGQATPLEGGHIPPGHWAHAEQVSVYPEQRVEQARQLLAEAGHADGFKTVLKVGSDFPYQVNAAEMVKQYLEEVGIEVEVRAMESSLFFDSLGSGDFELTVVGWLGAVDPDEYTYPIFHTDAEWNQQGYSNEQVDGWLEEGRRTFDKGARAELYAKAQEQIAKDAPVAFLYVNPRAVAMQPNVYGFVSHATVSAIFLRDTWIEE